MGLPARRKHSDDTQQAAIYIHYIYIIRQYAQKNDNAFQFTRHVSAWYSNHHQLKLLG